MPNLVKRKVAIERSLPRYFTGQPCKKGHVAERYTSSSECVACVRERTAIKTPHDSLRKRRSNLKTRYGMEITDYVDKIEHQKNRCAICRNMGKKLVVDHCHSRDKVRELLCPRCNNVLGLAEDNIDLLQSMIDYLIQHA